MFIELGECIFVIGGLVLKVLVEGNELIVFFLKVNFVFDKKIGLVFFYKVGGIEYFKDGFGF